jgi:hypothetical protein
VTPSQPQLSRITGGHAVGRGTQVPSPPHRPWLTAQYSAGAQSAFEVQVSAQAIAGQAPPGAAQIPHDSLQQTVPGPQLVCPHGS